MKRAKPIRILSRMILGLCCVVLLYLLLALVLGLIPTRSKPTPCPEGDAFYVSTNGIHLDIIIPRAYLTGEAWSGLVLPANIRYVAVGWGDQGFYLETPTWADLKATTALKALLWRSKTALHVSYYYRPQKQWKKLLLCPAQAEKMLTYIRSSFQEDSHGEVVLIPDAGYGQLDEFYEAQGSYSVLRTCNNWANQALKTAEVKTALWAPFDRPVLWHLD